VTDGTVRERTIDPLELGIARCAPGDLRGATPEDNAASLRNVLEGEHGPHRDAVLLNAAGAIAAAAHADDLAGGLASAREAIDSGAAAERLDQLVAFSRVEVAS
jgi:anthranilate phosphoribosyltransferase